MQSFTSDLDQLTLLQKVQVCFTGSFKWFFWAAPLNAKGMFCSFSGAVHFLNLCFSIYSLQVFEHALEMTSGNDLQQILWLKSPKQVFFTLLQD